MSNSPLTPHTPSAANLPVLATEADDFLPPPGGWSRRMGQRVLYGFGVILLASTVWPLERTVRAPGVVRPTGENSLVQTQLGGRLKQILVQANQQVRAQQVLAILDRGSLLNNREQLERELEQVSQQLRQVQQQQAALVAEQRSSVAIAEAQIASSRSDVEKAEASLGLANSERQRYGRLQASGAIPVALMEEKAARQSQAASELRQARLGVSQMRARRQAEVAKWIQAASSLRSNAAELERQATALRARLQEAQRALAEATIRAPIAGTVVATALRHPGQVLAPGEVVARLAPQQAALLVKVLVPAKDVAPIKPGQTAYLRVAGCPFSEFGVLPGRITGVSADTLAKDAAAPSADPLYEVSIQPSASVLRQAGRSCGLRLGMDLQADIVLGRTSVMSFLLQKLRLSTQL